MWWISCLLRLKKDSDMQFGELSLEHPTLAPLSALVSSRSTPTTILQIFWRGCLKASLFLSLQQKRMILSWPQCLQQVQVDGRYPLVISC